MSGNGKDDGEAVIKVMNLVQPDGVAILVNNDGKTEVVAQVNLMDIAGMGPAGVLMWMLVCQMHDVSKALSSIAASTKEASEKAANPLANIGDMMGQLESLVPGIGAMFQAATRAGSAAVKRPSG